MLLLISGQPHSGKSTLIANTCESFYGFRTEEIVGEDQRREGFSLISSDQQTACLASIHSKSKARVSRYGVEIPALEKFLSSLRDPRRGEISYIDEIGEMELLGANFPELVRRWEERSSLLIATISEVFSHPLIENLKREASAQINLTVATRGACEQQLLAMIASVVEEDHQDSR